MMKSYTAYCMNEDGENLCMTREYTSKAHFISDLHGNGYKVHFVALTDKYDEESAKYYERLETKRRRAAIRRECEREWKGRDAEIEKAVAEAVAEEPTTEEPAQEAKTMTATREFFNLETKNRFNAVQVDTDTSYYIKNVTDEKAAIRYALEKFVKKLETLGTQEARTIIDIIESCLSNDEFTESYNSIAEGGNAWEIEINDYNDGTMSIYIRIAEYMHEEPKDEQTAAEQPEEIPDFEAVKNQLSAKVEHISAENADIFSDYKTVVWRRRGDVAHSIWINDKRMSRETLRAWEESGIEERHIFKIAMENTMAEQKPRLHRNIFDFDAEPLESCALLEKFFNLDRLDDNNTVLLTTTEERKGGAIAAFYPPVLSKVSELFGGSGFYVAFTSLYEAMIHKLGSTDPASIRRNVRETNRIFDSKDTLSNDVWFYDPSTKQLAVVPE